MMHFWGLHQQGTAIQAHFIGCLSNEEVLVIATAGEGEEGEKGNLKICLAGELNLGLQRERQEHWTLYQVGLLKIVII